MNTAGKTAYMEATERVSIDVLAPRPSWKTLEAALPQSAPDTADELCETVYRLISAEWDNDRALRHLAVIDMLFCVHEGSLEELKARRITLFHRFLKPMIRKSVQGPLSKDAKALLMHVYNGMRGRHDNIEDASDGYSQDYKATLADATAGIEALYSNARDAMLLDEHAPELFDKIPKKMDKLQPNDMFHGRFTKPPRFAFSHNLVEAAKELQDVGAITSPDAMCDLIQLGRNRFLEPAQPEIFNDMDTDEFWQALVLIWSLALHSKILERFEKDMGEVANEGELRCAPIKGFARSFDKAKDYAREKELPEGPQRSLAPLHVIDVLRCSFTVGTVARNIEIGHELGKRFAVARCKNTHQRPNSSYADRKYLLVYQTEVAGSKVAVLCEVQILMKSYIDIKKHGHLLYELVR